MFYNTADLKNEKIILRLASTSDAKPEKSWLPGYYFQICLPDGTTVGNCDLRIGHNEKTYIGGNIGYKVDEKYRGHGYAHEACMLLFKLAAKHGMDYLYISCNPDNTASWKTIEKSGGILVEIADIPPDNPLYEIGERKAKIYRVNL